jgi:hypothetical protein
MIRVTRPVTIEAGHGRRSKNRVTGIASMHTRDMTLAAIRITFPYCMMNAPT